MSRFYQPLPFSTAYDFVAAKPVTLNGAVLNPGDPVDKEGLSPRRLRQLYEARIISPKAPDVIPASAVQPPPQEPAQEPQEPAQEPDSPDAGSEPGAIPVAVQEGASIEHRGFGRYFAVNPDGTEVGPMSKAEAQKLIEE